MNHSQKRQIDNLRGFFSTVANAVGDEVKESVSESDSDYDVSIDGLNEPDHEAVVEGDNSLTLNAVPYWASTIHSEPVFEASIELDNQPSAEANADKDEFNKFESQLSEVIERVLREQLATREQSELASDIERHQGELERRAELERGLLEQLRGLEEQGKIGNSLLSSVTAERETLAQHLDNERMGRSQLDRELSQSRTRLQAAEAELMVVAQQRELLSAELVDRLGGGADEIEKRLDTLNSRLSALNAIASSIDPEDSALRALSGPMSAGAGDENLAAVKDAAADGEQIAELSEQIVALTEDLSAKEEDWEQRRARLEEALREQTLVSAGDFAQLKDDYALAKSEAEASLASADAVRKELETSQSDQLALEEEFLAMVEQQDSASVAQDDLQAKNQALLDQVAELVELRDESESAQSTLAVVESRVESATASLEEVRGELAGEREEHRLEGERLSAEVDLLASKNSELIAQATSLQETVDRLDGGKEESRLHLEELSARVELAATENSELIAQGTSLQERVDRLDGEKEESRLHFEELTAKLELTASENSELIAKQSAFQQSVDSQVSQLDQAHTANVALRSKFERTENDLALLREETRLEVERRDSEHGELTQNSESALGELREQLSKTETELSAERSQTEDLTARLSEMSETYKQILVKEAQLLTDISVSDDSRSLATAELSQAQREIEKLRAEASATQSQLDAVCEDLDISKNQLDLLGDEKAGLVSQVENATQERESLLEIEQALRSQVAEGDAERLRLESQLLRQQMLGGSANSVAVRSQKADSKPKRVVAAQQKPATPAAQPASAGVTSAKKPASDTAAHALERHRLEMLSRPLDEVLASKYFEAVPWSGSSNQKRISIAAAGDDDSDRELAKFAVTAATEHAINESHSGTE